MTLTEQSIRLPNGVMLRYVEQGPAGAMPVILLHGFPDSWHSYESVLAHLSDSIRVIAVSQRGFGNSDRPATGYAPRDLAADLSNCMKLRDIPRRAGPRIVAPRTFQASSCARIVVIGGRGTFPRLLCLETRRAARSAEARRTDWNLAETGRMQYIRRRIQRVSGVTIRDERIESRDFSVHPQQENWNGARREGRDRVSSEREMRTLKRTNRNHGERA